jgi:hypothetical protein
MKVSELVDNLIHTKAGNNADSDPETRFFIINCQGEKVQVFVEDISVSQEGMEILLG